MAITREQGRRMAIWVLVLNAVAIGAVLAMFALLFLYAGKILDSGF